MKRKTNYKQSKKGRGNQMHCTLKECQSCMLNAEHNAVTII